MLSNSTDPIKLKPLGQYGLLIYARIFRAYTVVYTLPENRHWFTCQSTCLQCKRPETSARILQQSKQLTAIDLRNEFHFSEAYRSVNYIGSLAKFA